MDRQPVEDSRAKGSPSHKEGKPLVFVIVLNWNNWQDTLACLASLRRLDYPNYRILALDNGSTNDSEIRIREAFPRIDVIQTGANLGYAGGNNYGMRYALQRGAAFVLIVNPDIIIEPHALNVLVDTALSHATAAALGPIVRYLDSPELLWSTGTIINWSHGWILLDNTPVEGIPFRPTVGVAGCCVLLRANALRDVGLFDVKYFLYHEETDLCQRLINAGYSVGVCSEATAFHRPGSSSGENSPRQAYYAARNLFLFFSRYVALHDQRRGRVMWELYRQYLLNGYTIKAILRHDALAIARMRAYVDFMLGRFGRSRKYTG